MYKRLTIPIMALLALAGCASMPDDRGRAQTDRLVMATGLPDPGGRPELAAGLLSEPLGPQQAAQVALLLNPELRAAYARLGLSAADVYRAGRPGNPTLTASRLDSDQPGALDQVTFGLSQSFSDLLLLRDRSRLAREDFARAHASVAATAFDTATAAAEAWHRLAAAQQVSEALDASADAAGAAAELAIRFHEAGNFNRLELAQHRAGAAAARRQALAARLAATRARAELGRVMGVEAHSDWRIEPGLPPPHDDAVPAARLKREAADARLDLLAARRRVATLESALGVTRRWRWLGEVELELETERETDGSRLTGGGLSLELPIFHRHGDDVARAEARLDAAYAERDAVANRAGHEIELAAAALSATREQWQAYREGILSEHRVRVEETQKRVNYMLAGVFELVDARRAEYGAIADYLEVIRDYWLAHVSLERATGATMPPPAGDRRVLAHALMQVEAAHDEPADAGEHTNDHHGGHE